MRSIALLLASIALSACGTMPAPMNSDAYPKRQLALQINGVQGVGAMVVPHAEVYHVLFKSPDADMDYLQIDSCHREVIFEKAGSKFQYDYSPDAVELARHCPLEIQAVSKDKAVSLAAWVDFEDEAHTLPAVHRCNGETKSFGGASICQSATDLIQTIEFQAPVYFSSAQDECKGFTSKDGKVWEYRMARKRCTLGFMEKDGAHRQHRLVTLGYDSAILRKN